MATSPKVLILMADYGHDPTETAVPYTAFKEAGFDVRFATENGKAPECDRRMCEGVIQKLLVWRDPLIVAMSCHLSNHGPVRPASQGAKQEAVGMYRKMVASEECKNPLAWSAQGFSLDQFDMCFLPGGHEKSVRQLIDSDTVHKLFASYFPQTKKPGKKVVGAVCHGVMVLSESKGDDGKSVIYDCTTTSLPARFEQVAFWGTRAFLGDYYKTYGQGSEDVEMSVRKNLRNDKEQYKNSLGMRPFVVEDPNYNYITARFPNDVDLLSEKLVKLVQSLQ